MTLAISLFPEQASTLAPRVDALYFFLLAVTGFFIVVIAFFVLYFAIKYRRRSEEEWPPPPHEHFKLEVVWMAIPFVLLMAMFAWGASLFVSMSQPPPDALEIHVIGKQWMWQLQHPQGRREINELHVPLGRPVKLVLASEDVIHDFYLPAFRIKQDVIPGRFTAEWFSATQLGEYHLFCAEYCGTNHSRMRGRVVVMEPAKYEAWLAGAAADEPPARAGERLFTELRCITCHGTQAPTMAGLFGRRVRLQDGSTVIADENYLRESILEPQAKLVAGYPPLMPTFRSQITEEQLMQLIAFIKSLRAAASEEQP
jgi:cytochrome c oxidase subunit 2